jgi:hypothetical protein
MLVTSDTDATQPDRDIRINCQRHAPARDDRPRTSCDPAFSSPAGDDRARRDDQAPILALLDRLRRETGMGVLFVTHNLASCGDLDSVVVIATGASWRSRRARALAARGACLRAPGAASAPRARGADAAAPPPPRDPATG